MIQVKSLVIHELVKEQDSTAIELKLSSTTQTSHPKSGGLIETLLKSYKRSEREKAVFDTINENQFKLLFDLYLNIDTDDAFLTFTRDVMGLLRYNLTSISRAKGGYVVFCCFLLSGRLKFNIYLIRNTESMLFKYDNASNKFDINSVEHLNIEKLAMACSINAYNYLNETHSLYLSFIKSSRQEISGYFENWIGKGHGITTADLTKKLYEIVTSITPPLNRSTNEQMSRREFVNNVNSVIRERGKNVNLRELGSFYYDDENYILNFAEENNIEIDDTFIADGRSLTTFTEVEIKEDGIVLKFTKGDIDRKFTLSNDEQSLIVHSPVLANAYKIIREDYINESQINDIEQ